MCRKMIYILLIFPALIFANEIRLHDGPFVRELENKVSSVKIKSYQKTNQVTFYVGQLRNTHSIEAFSLYQTNNNYQIESKNLLGKSTIEENKITFNFSTPIKRSVLFPNWLLTVKYKPNADLSTTFAITKMTIDFENSPVEFSGDNKHICRVGTRLRKANQDGYYGYRIPGMITTKTGTVIAVYDTRNVKTVADLPNDINVGMSRSTDNGNTWEPMKIIMDMGDEHIGAYRGNGIGDPAVLLDEVTGTIWVAATWSQGNRSWVGSGKGLEPSETGQLMLTKSEDDGLTWSQPINITKQVKDPDWHFLLQGPGTGITLSDGTLVFPAQYQAGNEARTPHSTLIYSKDRGKTWQINLGPRGDTTESQVVELSDGSIMINCRDDRNRTGERIRTGGRAVYTTADLGKTWELHSTSDWTLPEPNCQASILKLPFSGNDGKNALAFFNPNAHRSKGVDGGKAGRANFTLQISYDDGLTWEKKILFDKNKGRGYSSISIIGDTLGILYEGSKSDLFFQKIPLSELEQ